MKKLTAVLLGCWLIASFALAGEPNAADQKWLQTVEKMVAKGEKKVTTPKEDRVTLLQEWAGKKGYAVKVTKTDTGFAIELSPKDTGKTVAQK
jgi:hypothetical protein